MKTRTFIYKDLDYVERFYLQTFTDHVSKKFSLSADKTYSIFFNGHPIRTIKGKSVWGGAGAAKNALNHFLRNFIFFDHRGKNAYLTIDGKKIPITGSASELSNKLIKLGLVEIRIGSH